MKEKIKSVLLGLAILAAGIFLTTVEGDTGLAIWGIIPINTMLVGIIAIVVGALWTLVALIPTKK